MEYTFTFFELRRLEQIISPCTVSWKRNNKLKNLNFDFYMYFKIDGQTFWR